VVLDEQTVSRYEREEGELGERLRAAMTRDADGDVCFTLRDGRCPFLDEEELCEIHRALGEEATSVTCREHPRFSEDYGAVREITLSASCPAANALLLGSRGPLRFLETGDPDAAPDPESEGFLEFRDGAVGLLEDRTLPLGIRLRDFLRAAADAELSPDGRPASQAETSGQPSVTSSGWWITRMHSLWDCGAPV